jgi:hypothetical protein
MANYPNKPWSDGQTFEVVPGETFVYDASQSVWTHQTKATLDSDFQVTKTALEASITENDNAITVLQARADSDEIALQALRIDLNTEIAATNADVISLSGRIDVLDVLSDSEAARVQSAVDDINAAFAMLDSDGINLQALRTDLNNVVNATAAVVFELTDRLDSDELVLQSLQEQVNALNLSDVVIEADHDSDIAVVDATIANLAIPVVSAVQPTGQTGMLWINTTDGKLYYWNDSDTFVSIVTV